RLHRQNLSPATGGPPACPGLSPDPRRRLPLPLYLHPWYPLGTPVLLGLDAKVWPARGATKSQATLSFPAAPDRGASAGRRCRCGVRAGPIGPCQYSEHDGVHALHDSHARCADAAAVCQSSCSLTSSSESQPPQVLALSILDARTNSAAEKMVRD